MTNEEFIERLRAQLERMGLSQASNWRRVMSDEWVLVPREPTEAMFSASSFQEWDTFEQEWRAMLYAAPAAEVQRLRDALKPFAAIDLTTNQAVDAMDVLRARRALEGQ